LPDIDARGIGQILAAQIHWLDRTRELRGVQRGQRREQQGGEESRAKRASLPGCFQKFAGNDGVFHGCLFHEDVLLVLTSNMFNVYSRMIFKVLCPEMVFGIKPLFFPSFKVISFILLPVPVI